MLLICGRFLVGCIGGNPLDEFKKTDFWKQEVIVDEIIPPFQDDKGTYTYSSSHPEILSSECKLNRPATTTQVKISVELTTTSNVKHTDEKTFTVTGLNEYEADFNLLFAGVDKQHVTSDLPFPATIGSSKVDYVSNNPSVIANNGKVIRPSVDTDVEVTVNVYRGNDYDYQQKVTFKVLGEGSVVDQLLPLRNALTNFTNYTMEYLQSWDYREDDEYDDSSFSVYNVDGIKTHWLDSEYYNYYVINDPNGRYGIYEDDEYDVFYKAMEGTSDYEDYIIYFGQFDDLNFSTIIADDMELVDGYYVPKAGKLETISKAIFGDFDYSDADGTYADVFSELKIKVVEDKIVEITAKSLYTETYSESEIYQADYVYTITFSNHGTVNVNVPDLTETEDTGLTAAEIRNCTDGDAVETAGNIVGIMGKTIYVADSTGYMTYYFADKDTTVSVDNLQVGDYIKITGSKTTYKGLIEVQSITSLEVVAEKHNLIQPLMVDDIADLNDASWQSALVSITNAEVVSACAATGSSGDYKLVIRQVNGTTNIDVYIKAIMASAGVALFENLAVGDVITLQNVIVGCYNTAQLMVIDSTSIDSPDGLSVYYDEVTVDYNTSLEDVLAANTVTLIQNGVATTLTRDEYVVTNAQQYNPQVSGDIRLEIAYGDLYTIYILVHIKPAPQEAFVPDDALILDGVAANQNLTIGMPSTGDVNVLVFPIAFTDRSYPSNYKTTIETAFNGTEAETGWHSINSYYKATSYNKLNITGTVMDAYHTNKPFPVNATFDSNQEYDYIKSVLTYYDDQIDYSQYDANSDGYIDCIYLIYLAEYNIMDDNSLWWAFTGEYFTDDFEYYDNIEADYYIFASYYFLEEPIMFAENSRDDVYININAVTFIHETGHALGLDDYYDYDLSVGVVGGIGGSDMMDSNIGDHNAYTKTILGWITPTVVTGEDYTVTLEAFATSGDAIVIAKNWNNSFMDEYYIIDFYVPEGLNELCAGYNGLFSIAGIRIYHIDATLNKTQQDSIFNITLYNNAKTDHKLISLVEADGNNDIENNSFDEYGGLSENSDLFQAGDFFSGTWYDGTSGGFTVTVTSITDQGAEITITYH